MRSNITTCMYMRLLSKITKLYIENVPASRACARGPSSGPVVCVWRGHAHPSGGLLYIASRRDCSIGFWEFVINELRRLVLLTVLDLRQQTYVSTKVSQTGVTRLMPIRKRWKALIGACQNMHRHPVRYSKLQRSLPTLKSKGCT